MIDYCGATSRLDPDDAFKLDPRRYAFQAKCDGCYARVELDAAGAIARVTSRNGRELREASDLLGIVAGEPLAVLHGELEAHTEAGNTAAAARGWRNLHLFDVTAIGDRDLKPLNYSERYATLHRMQAAIELTEHGRITTWSRDASGRLHDAGDGRFVRGVPRDLRRLPIVALHRGRGAGEQLWREHVERDRGEGLVAVCLDAPAGARGGKRKVKATDTIDAVVIAADVCTAELAIGGTSFFVPAAKLDLVPGQVVEVQHDGRYANGTPRFPRIVRARRDLPAFN